MIGSEDTRQSFRMRGDEGQILGQPVVQIAGDPQPFGRQRVTGHLPLRLAIQHHADGDQHRERSDPKGVARRHPVGWRDRHPQRSELSAGQQDRGAGEQLRFRVIDAGTASEADAGDQQQR